MKIRSIEDIDIDLQATEQVINHLMAINVALQSERKIAVKAVYRKTFGYKKKIKAK